MRKEQCEPECLARATVGRLAVCNACAAAFLVDLGSMSRKHPYEKAAPVTGSGHLLRGHNVLFSSSLLPSVVSKFVLTYIPVQFTVTFLLSRHS